MADKDEGVLDLTVPNTLGSGQYRDFQGQEPKPEGGALSYLRNRAVDFAQGVAGIPADIAGTRTAFDDSPEAQKSQEWWNDIKWKIGTLRDARGKWEEESPDRAPKVTGPIGWNTVDAMVRNIVGIAPYAGVALTGPAAPYVGAGLMAATGAGAGRNQNWENYRFKSPEDMQGDPAYPTYKKHIDEGMDHPQALRATWRDMNDIGSDLIAAGTSGLGGIGIGHLGMKIIGRTAGQDVAEAMAQRIAAKGRLKQGGLGALEGGAGFGVMGGGEELAQERRMHNVGGPEPTVGGVLGAAVEPFVAGALIGGTGRFVRPERPKPVPPIGTAEWYAAQSQLGDRQFGPEQEPRFVGPPEAGGVTMDEGDIRRPPPPPPRGGAGGPRPGAAGAPAGPGGFAADRAMGPQPEYGAPAEPRFVGPTLSPERETEPGDIGQFGPREMVGADLGLRAPRARRAPSTTGTMGGPQMAPEDLGIEPSPPHPPLPSEHRQMGREDLGLSPEMTQGELTDPLLAVGRGFGPERTPGERPGVPHREGVAEDIAEPGTQAHRQYQIEESIRQLNSMDQERRALGEEILDRQDKLDREAGKRLKSEGGGGYGDIDEVIGDSPDLQHEHEAIRRMMTDHENLGRDMQELRQELMKQRGRHRRGEPEPEGEVTGGGKRRRGKKAAKAKREARAEREAKPAGEAPRFQRATFGYTVWREDMPVRILPNG